jgi:hypothetical protein
MAALVFHPSIQTLTTILEEGARANSRSTGRFIEPAEGTLRRATSRRHHIVFGRRGSGKSSLLFKSSETLSSDGRPIAYVDLEPFKGHHYPDLLISVLLAVFTKFRTWLSETPLRNERRRRWFTGFLWKTGTATQEKKESLLQLLTETITDLSLQLHSADGAALSTKLTTAEKQGRTAGIKAKVGSQVLDTKASVESEIAQSVESNKGVEQQEEFKRSKQDYLHRKIIDFQDVFLRFTTLTNGDCFIFLDDLYHIHRADQPRLIDYFHRIVKGCNVWLKIGSIRNRSTWYTNSPQPTGLKLGDDADEVNLDLTLEKFTVSREFLRSVVNTYIREASAPALDELLADGGLDRLVLASGGVTRDFLGLFRRAIDETRERLTKAKDHPRGEKIGAEDVNLAAGAYGETKKEEFKRDTLDDRQRLEDAFSKICAFCLEKIKTNVFLVDQDLKGSDSEFVQELVDLRLVHHVKSRVTVPDRPGRAYRALLLDVSQYTGERKKRDVDMLEFWRDANKDALRRTRLVYDPSISVETLRREIEEKLKRAPERNDSNDQTPELFPPSEAENT